MFIVVGCRLDGSKMQAFFVVYLFGSCCSTWLCLTHSSTTMILRKLCYTLENVFKHYRRETETPPKPLTSTYNRNPQT